MNNKTYYFKSFDHVNPNVGVIIYERPAKYKTINCSCSLLNKTEVQQWINNQDIINHSNYGQYKVTHE